MKYYWKISLVIFLLIGYILYKFNDMYMCWFLIGGCFSWFIISLYGFILNLGGKNETSKK